ncbi:MULTISPECIES: hypothetical protein [Pseudomonas]|uniref:Minor tail protein n=1 Tax=Pseudomonas glycinae TaxID=1785145 RepID=A0ABM5ZKM5_9PSED|nr:MULTISPECIES: hypothetical protein [Pseudomonas]AMQ84219.1 hypothetical protein AWU82_13135 [Pseudomonas glycinae]NKF25026.1 hypothetical protein [Pseudomonas sp. BG5]
MTSFQTGTAGQGGGTLSAPLPELPDGRGPDRDIVPVTAIPVGGSLQLLLDTTVPDNRQNGDQVAIDITRTQPPAVPTPADYTRLPRVTLPDMPVRPDKFAYSVPTEYLGEDATPPGPTTFWVRCVYYERGLNALTSAFVPFRIDRTAPWQEKPIQTPPNPGQRPGVKLAPRVSFPNAPGDLDDAWAGLPESAKGLLVAIDTTYTNAQPDDHVQLYFANQRTNPPQVPPFFEGDMPVDGEVWIPIDELRKITSGRAFIWFRILDVAGNESAWSVSFKNTRFLPLPELGPLRVPTNDDGLIDLNDARAGVTVEVDRPVNALNDDEVSLKWGSQAAQDLEFGTLNKLVFTIPWAALSKEYFENQTGANYEVPVQVKADLMRNLVSVSEVDTRANTDFSTHPPYTVDPLIPPPVVNPEFRKAIVRGQAPVTDNLLGPHDANQTATIYIDVSPVTPGTTFPDPEDGDLVTAYFLGDAGEVVVGSMPMDVTNINTEIELPLLYSIVGPGGLGKKKVWWVYENPGRNNIQTSAETDVTVNTVVINLDPPEFVRPLADGTADPFIICESLTVSADDHVARFRIPPNNHFVDGMPITFNWRGFRTEDYQTPAPSDTEYTETRNINASELIAGMIFDVGPYDPVIRDVPRPPPATPDPSDFYAGYVKVWYSTPTVPTSGVTEMTVYLLNADFLYCESEPGWDPEP